MTSLDRYEEKRSGRFVQQRPCAASHADGAGAKFNGPLARCAALFRHRAYFWRMRIERPL